DVDVGGDARQGDDVLGLAAVLLAVVLGRKTFARPEVRLAGMADSSVGHPVEVRGREPERPLALLEPEQQVSLWCLAPQEMEIVPRADVLAVGTGIDVVG